MFKKTTLRRVTVSLLLFTLLFVFSGCKKSNDYAAQLPVENKQAIIEKFLHVPEDASPFIKGIVNDLKKREKTNPFIVETAKRNGFPVWDKMIGQSSKGDIGKTPNENGKVVSLSTTNNTNHTNTGIAYIPLIDTLTKEIKSYIFCVKRNDTTYSYNTYNKSAILSQQGSIDAIKKSANTVLLGVHAFFEKSMNGKDISTISSKEKGYELKDVNISFNATINQSNSTISSNSIKKDVIPFMPCLVYLGSSTVTFTRENGSSYNVHYHYFAPCSVQTILPDVVVYSSVSNGGGGNITNSSGLGFIGLLPSGSGNLFSTINWNPSSGSGSGGTNTGNGLNSNNPYLEDPNLAFWGNPQLPDNIRRAEFLARALGIGQSANSIAYISSYDNLMTIIENALQRGGFSAEIKQATNKVIEALELAKIDISQAPQLLEEFLESEGAEEDLLALELTIEAIAQGVADDEDISEAFFNTTIQPRLPAHFLQPIGLTYLQFTLEKQKEYAIQKQKNDLLPIGSRLPKYRIMLKVYGEIFHTAMDLMGLIPVGGEIFDILNATVYFLQGDKTNAWLSTGSAIPFLGYAATSAKLIKAGSIIIAVKGTDNIFRVARKSQAAFTRATGAVAGQVGHHLISFHKVVQEHDLMQLAFRAGFNPNDALQNGKAIAATLNSGNHATYANKLAAAMTNIQRAFPNLNPLQAKEKLIELIEQIKPGQTHLNFGNSQ